MRNKILYSLCFLFITGIARSQTNNFPPSGNVGVGTLNPSNVQGWNKVLEVYGNSSAKLLVSTNLESVKVGLFAHYNWSGARGIVGTESSHDLSIQAGYSEKIRVKLNGNVGIGTNNPTHKLAVNGTIQTKEVNITTAGWADYVFKPEYKLMPLSELEAFIQKNGHLPDVPTEAEVMENGVNLAEMNVKLLEKVEELTLHLIRQEELIKDLYKRIDSNEK
ncbi:hypothetical protein LZF95_21035 [Algoriphagus sp. AGSA1]|uniref:hypothetical protein n=1 Tax=Algoriphagus sp. AGSA1 TaxID=2907213 RepID=UPI001F1E51A3|nr:hypothetical protein [Algoriphagus sp. AGSA1]MCE7057179.1 hypothetical protein [Algoriphagus sp. AGSA1]